MLSLMVAAGWKGGAAGSSSVSLAAGAGAQHSNRRLQLQVERAAGLLCGKRQERLDTHTCLLMRAHVGRRKTRKKLERVRQLGSGSACEASKGMRGGSAVCASSLWASPVCDSARPRADKCDPAAEAAGSGRIRWSQTLQPAAPKGITRLSLAGRSKGAGACRESAQDGSGPAAAGGGGAGRGRLLLRRGCCAVQRVEASAACASLPRPRSTQTLPSSGARLKGGLVETPWAWWSSGS